MFVKLLGYNLHSDTVENNQRLFPRHLHSYYEFYLFLKGDVTYIIEDKSYEMKPYRLLFIRPYTYHFPLFLGNGQYRRISMHFMATEESGGFLEELFKKYEVIDVEKYPELMSIFEMLIKHGAALDRKKEFCLAESCLTQLILTVDRVAGNVEVENTEFNPIIKRAITYINQNIEKRISLEDLSENLYISKNYLAKLFKRHFNIPIAAYIRNKQLLLADNMIRSGTSPTDVYLKCGFWDYSSFYRAYVKMFGRSPSTAKG